MAWPEVKKEIASWFTKVPAHLQHGRLGESAAKKHLQKLGLKFLLANFGVTGKGEIDLIFREEDCLVFVEVKTRGTDRYGYPEEAVDYRKEALLLDAAGAYIEETGWQHEVRFDIISITLTSPPTIYHIEDAFH